LIDMLSSLSSDSAPLRGVFLNVSERLNFAFSSRMMVCFDVEVGHEWRN
jgi:hypothetical protein